MSKNYYYYTSPSLLVLYIPKSFPDACLVFDFIRNLRPVIFPLIPGSGSVGEEDVFLCPVVNGSDKRRALVKIDILVVVRNMGVRGLHQIKNDIFADFHIGLG